MNIQQFPVGWIISGSITEKYKQIGNAVRVGHRAATGKTIIGLIKK
jgi:site-specific DNA-cytosine methylase